MHSTLSFLQQFLGRTLHSVILQNYKTVQLQTIVVKLEFYARKIFNDSDFLNLECQDKCWQRIMQTKMEDGGPTLAKVTF